MTVGMDTISWYGRLNTARRRGALRFKKCVFIRPRATRPSDDPSSTRFPDVQPSTHLSVSHHPQGPRATQPSDDSPSTRFSDVLPSTQRSGVFTMRTGQGPHSSDDEKTFGGLPVIFCFCPGFEVGVLGCCVLGRGVRPDRARFMFFWGPDRFFVGCQPENWPFTMFHGRRPEERQHDRHPLTRSARIRACPVEYLLELCPLPLGLAVTIFTDRFTRGFGLHVWIWAYCWLLVLLKYMFTDPIDDFYSLGRFLRRFLPYEFDCGMGFHGLHGHGHLEVHKGPWFPSRNRGGDGDGCAPSLCTSLRCMSDIVPLCPCTGLYSRRSSRPQPRGSGGDVTPRKDTREDPRLYLLMCRVSFKAHSHTAFKDGPPSTKGSNPHTLWRAMDQPEPVRRSRTRVDTDTSRGFTRPEGPCVF